MKIRFILSFVMMMLIACSGCIVYHDRDYDRGEHRGYREYDGDRDRDEHHERDRDREHDERGDRDKDRDHGGDRDER